ncbi:MAG: nucleoside hydrolase [Chloroflexi bacterium]|nr:nucleoside hydrolase [Chloroflexota bacterium]
MNWIIDTDAGVDDAIGIAMPFVPGRYPDFKLIAITTVAGNVPLHKVNVNVGAVLELLQQPMPFYAGCDRPLVEPYVDAADFHGDDGLGDGGLSHTVRQPEAEHAALALVRLAREYAGHFSVIALGPLTNIALACNLDREFAHNVSRLVIMGGAWRGQGNQSSAAEFNFAIDPESAKVVFERFDARVELLPWETSLDCMYSFERFDAVAKTGTARAHFLNQMVAKLNIKMREQFKLAGFPMPDPLAVAVALDPTLIRGERVARVKVDVGHDAGRALSTLEFRRAHPNTRVVVDMDYERAFEMIDAAWSV